MEFFPRVVSLAGDRNQLQLEKFGIMDAKAPSLGTNLIVKILLARVFTVSFLFRNQQNTLEFVWVGYCRLI